MTAYMASLRKIQRLHLEVLYPGHGPAEHDPATVIAEYLSHRLEREQQILEVVGSGVTTVDAIVAIVYEEVDPALHPLAAIGVRAHLEKLAGEGIVRVDEGEVTVL